jgi:hypothetical protein
MRRHFGYGWYWLQFLLMFVAALAIFGWATMFLWNALLTTLFNLPVIDFWQALGLLVLSRLLVGGIGSHAHALMFLFHRNGMDFRNRMRERWEKMTPEERINFHEKFDKFHGKFHRFFDEEHNNVTKPTQES